MQFKLIRVLKRGIEPIDIDASVHLWGAFGHSETETSAGWIVRFCQDRGKGWNRFTYADIDAYYKSKGFEDGFRFNKLLQMGYIYIYDNCPGNERYRPDTIFQIDFRFVAKCYVIGLGQRFGDMMDT